MDPSSSVETTSIVDGNANMSRTSSNNSIRSPLDRTSQMALGCYCLLFAAVTATVSTTIYRFPLFPFQPNSLEWNYAWLITTVVDYYGACLCFCGVVLSSEPSWARGIAWNLFLLLGSPACCLWVILRIGNGGSLRLVGTNSRQSPSNADLSNEMLLA